MQSALTMPKAMKTSRPLLHEGHHHSDPPSTEGLIVETRN